MITHYIISDLHLANGGRRDDFKKNRTRFKNFLQMVKKQKAQLIIAGDFLELWQVNLIAITRAYSDILNQLISMNTKIVIGNHDYYLYHFRRLKFLYDSLRIPRHSGQAGTKIFVQHGHQFDRFNDLKRLMYLGNLAAMSAAVMEDIHPDLDEKAMSFLKLLDQKLSWLPSWAPGTRRREYLSEGGDLSEYLKGAKRLLKKFYYVILGHTHQPGTAFEGRYLNVGSWTSSKPTYVEINAQGQCTLKYWPTQRPVKKLL